MRRTWSLALDVVTFLAGKQGNDPLRRAARHTALALRQDVPGRNLPFFRQGIEQQMLFTIAVLTGNEARLGEGGVGPGGFVEGEGLELPDPDEEPGLILTDR